MTSQSDRKPVLRVLQGQQRDPRMKFAEHLRATPPPRASVWVGKVVKLAAVGLFMLAFGVGAYVLGRIAEGGGW